MGLIQDVKPPYRPPKIPDSVMERLKHQVDADYVKSVDSSVLVKELYQRGVPYEKVFGLYYELERVSEFVESPLTVGDARLAGHGQPVIDYKQPF